MMHIPSLVLINLVPGSLYLLTTLCPPSLVTSNLISFSMSLLLCIIDLQHNVNSYYVTWWFDISKHFKLITTMILLSNWSPQLPYVTTQRHYIVTMFHSLYISYPWLISLITVSLHLLIPLTYFLLFPKLSPLENTYLFPVSKNLFIFLSFLFISLFFF